MMKSLVFTATAVCLAAGLTASLANAQPALNAALEHSIRQLQESRGSWSVTTEFLKPDGSVAKAAAGTYDFEWVIKDRVLKGVSEIPELGNKSRFSFM
jgi:hypothetical protein